mmetsp:Transcript_3309/g.13634  ORF Transcript_3309/g.13634 Transcript_3309/m.13634 type:complete len:222 (-) Transcript_3309:1432-2097(-)
MAGQLAGSPECSTYSTGLLTRPQLTPSLDDTVPVRLPSATRWSITSARRMRDVTREPAAPAGSDMGVSVLPAAVGECTSLSSSPSPPSPSRCDSKSSAACLSAWRPRAAAASMAALLRPAPAAAPAPADADEELDDCPPWCSRGRLRKFAAAAALPSGGAPPAPGMPLWGAPSWRVIVGGVVRRPKLPIPIGPDMGNGIESLQPDAGAPWPPPPGVGRTVS